MVQMVKRGTAFIFLVKNESYNVVLLQFFTFSPCVIVAHLSGQTEQGTWTFLTEHTVCITEEHLQLNEYFTYCKNGPPPQDPIEIKNIYHRVEN